MLLFLLKNERKLDVNRQSAHQKADVLLESDLSRYDRCHHSGKGFSFVDEVWFEFFMEPDILFSIIYGGTV